jgi:glucosamine--fructose-6-phosphate aminotransferase (isomerizing)
MCGIVGGVTERKITPILLEGLRRLEYRGYDSMGIALLDESGEIWSRRSVGRVHALSEALGDGDLSSGAGIAHTRWATHGAPSVKNAHPQISKSSIAVVHNGIIENYQILRRDLETQGYIFTSDTDTEVIAHLIQSFTEKGLTVVEAVRTAMTMMEGHYAIGVLSREEPNRLIAAKKGSPLVIGYGAKEWFMASDISALINETQRFAYLEDGDLAVLSDRGVAIFDLDQNPVERLVSIIDFDDAADALEDHPHHMHQEIHQQPRVLRKTLHSLLGGNSAPLSFLTSEFVSRLKNVKIVACGTSYNAGLVAKYWLEGLAGIACDVEIASEYRYRDQVVQPGTLFISISQSGETADTLAALRLASQMEYLDTLSICNVQTSSLLRLSKKGIITQAGPEIGVASTKAFTTQLLALLLFSLGCSLRRGMLSNQRVTTLHRQIIKIDSIIRKALEIESAVKEWGKIISRSDRALILGRGSMYPIALEGALKLKETSYISIEAYPAGELKHGPLALVDEQMPVIALLSNSPIASKTLSNLEEVRARGGQIFLIADESVRINDNLTDHILRLPSVDEVITPLLFTIPLQLLAYHTAVLRGTDVDKPRNLAKSVTVE